MVRRLARFGPVFLGIFADNVNGRIEGVNVDRLNISPIANRGPQLQDDIDCGLGVILDRPELDVGFRHHEIG